MDYIMQNVSSSDLVYGFIGIGIVLFLFAVIRYLFDRSGGYF